MRSMSIHAAPPPHFVAGSARLEAPPGLLLQACFATGAARPRRCIPERESSLTPGYAGALMIGHHCQLQPCAMRQALRVSARHAAE